MVDDKWLARLEVAVQGELDRVSQTLTGRIRQLAERYVTPLPQAGRKSTGARCPRREDTSGRWGRHGSEAWYKKTEAG